MGVKVLYARFTKKPVPHLKKPFVTLFDFLSVLFLALTSKSLRFFPLLYATTDCFGKILFKRE